MNRSLALFTVVLLTLVAAATAAAQDPCAMTARNGSGSSVGRVVSDGTFRNTSGSSIGRFESGGTVRNSSGSSVGRIDSDGTVRNSAGSSRGRFDSYSSSCAHCAVAYLFFFEPLYNQ